MWGIQNVWKRPITWGLIALAVVAYGNACAPNFSFMDPNDFGSVTQTCTSDESLINDFAGNPNLKSGYIGNNYHKYINRGDGLIQINGDMLVFSKGDLPSSPLQGAQQGVGVGSGNIWPNGVIPYTIDSGFSSTMRNRILTAINHWNSSLGGVITLKARANETDYAAFTVDSSGCAAVVGRTPNGGAHPVYLATACDAGNAAHEIGHIVGLDHEQNRLDRNDYVTINYSKVTSGYEDNFSITSNYKNYNYYDFGSIMHYSLYAFSTDGAATILPRVAVPAGVTVGQRSGLTKGDINSVRSMYGAALIPDESVPVVSNGAGITARYYDDSEFKTLAATQVDSKIDFDWARTAPVAAVDDDIFSIRWTGYLTPETTGTHTFKVTLMDEIRVVLNGQTIFEITGANGAKEAISLPITLSQGTKYSLVVEYRASDDNRNSYLHLNWTKPNGVSQIIPASAFSPDSGGLINSPCSTTWSQ